MNTAEFLAKKYGYVLLILEEVAAEFRLGVKTFQNKVSAGEIDLRRKEGQHTYHVDDVAAAIDARRVASDPHPPAEAGCAAAESTIPRGLLSARLPGSADRLRRSLKSPRAGGRAP
jgi:hypothetical protein